MTITRRALLGATATTVLAACGSSSGGAEKVRSMQVMRQVYGSDPSQFGELSRPSGTSTGHRRGRPRRVLAVAVRPLARTAAGRRPGAARVHGVEPGVPPGRQRRRLAGDLRRRCRRDRQARRPRRRHVTPSSRSGTAPAASSATWVAGRAKLPPTRRALAATCDVTGVVSQAGVLELATVRRARCRRHGPRSI